MSGLTSNTLLIPKQDQLMAFNSWKCEKEQKRIKASFTLYKDYDIIFTCILPVNKATSSVGVICTVPTVPTQGAIPEEGV